MGAFSKIGNAESLQKQLKNKGFDAIIKDMNGLYKCQVGAFKNKANAELLMDSIVKQGFTAFVTYC